MNPASTACPSIHGYVLKGASKAGILRAFLGLADGEVVLNPAITAGLMGFSLRLGLSSPSPLS